jgi:hypothetical protein
MEGRATGTGKKRARRRLDSDAEVSSEEFWSRRWSFARYTLRLSESEFWESTPRSLDHLADRLMEERKRQDWHVALTVSTIVNTSQFRPKEGVKPEDFMPRYDDDPEPEKVDNDMRKKVASISLTSIIKGLFERQERNRPKGIN